MQVSFYSVLMAVLWSSLFCVIICLLRKFKEGYLYYNIAPLSILLFGCVFRCVLPLDFPGFTQNVTSSGAFVSINNALYAPIAVVGKGQNVTPLMIFFLVWIAGTVILTGIFFWDYFRSMYYLGVYEDVESGPAYEIAADLCKKQSIKRFRILKDASIRVPHVRGFLFPVLLLPDIEYTVEQLRYIISHELAHWKNGDMWVRLITVLICYLFWWNPIIYLLLYRMDETLELRCDATVVAAHCISDDERYFYLDVIEKATKDEKSRRNAVKQLFSVESELSGHHMKKKEIQKRADLIGDYRPNPKMERRVTIFTAAFMAVLLVFSYRFILQPHYDVEEEEIQKGTGTIQLVPGNSFLLRDSDGSYLLYVNEQYYVKLASTSGEKLISDGFKVRSNPKLEE